MGPGVSDRAKTLHRTRGEGVEVGAEGTFFAHFSEVFRLTNAIQPDVGWWTRPHTQSSSVTKNPETLMRDPALRVPTTGDVLEEARFTTWLSTRIS
mmetsp:Transcript_47738/g.137938  ORF Transcript_47738/g.137938 Transcript_47738/m.137938 type:complete len:96 (-) Transcript_47738:990-1277(-)